MSRPARHAAPSPTAPSIPSRAVDVARRAHEREGTRGSDFWNPAGEALGLCGLSALRSRRVRRAEAEDQLEEPLTPAGAASSASSASSS